MKLLEPIKVGHTTFKNRIMFPPLTTGYEEKDGTIGPKSFNFYKRLAEGGVGYIVIGDVVPTATLSPTPKLYLDSQIESYKKLADACHEFDCKLGLQIFHPDYDCDALMQMMKEGKSRQEIFAKLHYDMQHYVSEVSHDQIKVILDKITACVKRAVKAGVDVIEVHGDRLVGSLCSTILNHRTDEYGGCFENRIRFALEVVEAIKAASSTITIDYKLPIVTVQKDGSLIGKGGLLIEEAVELAKRLEAAGVHTIHVAQANHTGNMNDTIPAMGTRDYSFMVEECRLVKNAVSIPVSTVGRILIDDAEKLVEEGTCDIVAFGRGLLADEDLVRKLENNQKHLIRQCICCNKGCTDSIMASRFISCVLNPENGYEYERFITKAEKQHKVLVVGGGLAGLEAARVATLKGHKVTVIEKTDKLYGQIQVASLPPRKNEMLRVCKYYDNIIKEYNIEVLLNHPFNKDEANNYDDIIVCIGAVNSTPGIPGIEHTLDAWEVLKNPSLASGKVLIAGGGLVGCETAELLATKGYEVGIVEMQDTVAKEESKTILPTMMAEFKTCGVKTYTLHKIVEIKENGIQTEVIDKDNNVISKEFIEADTIIRALSSKKLALDLTGVNANVIYAGDCKQEAPCTVDNAITTGYLAANSIN